MKPGYAGLAAAKAAQKARGRPLLRTEQRSAEKIPALSLNRARSRDSAAGSGAGGYAPAAARQPAARAAAAERQAGRQQGPVAAAHKPAFRPSGLAAPRMGRAGAQASTWRLAASSWFAVKRST